METRDRVVEVGFAVLVDAPPIDTHCPSTGDREPRRTRVSFWQSNRRFTASQSSQLHPSGAQYPTSATEQFLPRGVAHNEAEVRGPHYVLQEQRRGLRSSPRIQDMFVPVSRSTPTLRITSLVVGKELDGLRLAVFRDAETLLRQIADQAFLVVADREVDGDQIHPAQARRFPCCSYPARKPIGANPCDRPMPKPEPPRTR